MKNSRRYKLITPTKDVKNFLFFIMYFGLQDTKPPPCPLHLTKQGGSIHCSQLYLYTVCKLVLYILETITMYCMLKIFYNKVGTVMHKPIIFVCNIFFLYKKLKQLKIWYSYKTSKDKTCHYRTSKYKMPFPSLKTPKPHNVPTLKRPNPNTS